MVPARRQKCRVRGQFRTHNGLRPRQFGGKGCHCRALPAGIARWSHSVCLQTREHQVPRHPDPSGAVRALCCWTRPDADIALDGNPHWQGPAISYIARWAGFRRLRAGCSRHLGHTSRRRSRGRATDRWDRGEIRQPPGQYHGLGHYQRAWDWSQRCGNAAGCRFSHDGERG